MTPIHIVLLFLVGIGGGFVMRVSGFGMGIFAMMFLPHFMLSHTASAAISCLFSLCLTTYNAIKYRKQIQFRMILPTVVAALITISVSVFFAAKVSSRIFNIMLGVVLILLSIFFLFLHQRIRIKPTLPNGLIAGALGGTLSGLFSTGGPPIVLYLTQATTDKVTYFATIQFYFLVTDFYATAMRIANGILTWNLVGMALIGVAGCLLGNAIGRIVFDKLDGNTVKKIIYIGMLISGVLMVI